MPISSRPPDPPVDSGQRYDTETIETGPQWVRSRPLPAPLSSRRAVAIGTAVGAALSVLGVGITC
jgi:hypothetical protein